MAEAAQDDGSGEPGGGEVEDPKPEGKESGSEDGEESKPDGEEPKGYQGLLDGEPEGEEEVKSDAPKDSDVPVIPEQYEYEFPEGYTFSDDQRKATDAAFNDLKLTQEQATKLSAFGFARDAEQAQLQTDGLKTLQDSWKKSIDEDVKLGGDNLPATLQVANAAIKKFEGQEVVKFLRSFGAANHDGFLRLMHRIGLAFGEDTVTDSGNKEPGRTSDGEDGFRDFYADTMGNTQDS